MEAQNEMKKEFAVADKKFDEMAARPVSNVRMKDKRFMTISDVDPEDAAWFKKFCDENFDGKQFIGIKLIRTVMERMDPFTKNVLGQINDLNARMDALEAVLKGPPAPEKKGVVIPQTMGAARRAQQ